jgi:hypothetical protein
MVERASQEGIGGEVMQIHELKTWPGAFEPTRLGKKTAEFRKDDRGFKVGDLLLLREWRPDRGQYTGLSALFEVTDIQWGPLWGIPEGYVMMSIAPRRIVPV